MNRWVLHIDMDAFFASVEQLTRPTLRGRPVLVGGVGGRGVVAGCSYEARAYGAHSARPMFQALRLVGPRAVTVSPRKSVYSAASKRVFEVISSKVDVVEQLSVDEGFMEPPELAGAGVAEVRAWAEELRAEIRGITGLPSSIGAGPGKQYAKIGSDEAKPDGTFVFEPEHLERDLHPMDVAKLWGVGPVTEAKLTAMGVETIGQLAALSEREVEISLGSTTGLNQWRLARGVDDREVAPRAIAKQISAEHTYARDLTTRAEVDRALTRAAEGAHRRLLADGRGARTVTVKLRMADFHIESRSATLPYATDDVETLSATAFRLVRYPDEVGPVRLVGVSLSGLEEGRQHVLFPELDRQIARKAASTDGDYETGVSDHGDVAEVVVEQEEVPVAGGPRFAATQDVHHPEYGHGWVQGTGHGVVSVRFETRATGPGPTRTFAVDDEQLVAADPLDSLAWEDWFARRAQED